MWNPFKSQTGKDSGCYDQAFEEAVDRNYEAYKEEIGEGDTTPGSPSIVTGEFFHLPFANCKTCGGYFSPDKLTEAYTISIFSGTESARYPTVDTGLFCINCAPEYEFRLSFMVGWFDKGVKKVEEDDYRDFITKEGWFQEVDGEGNHLIAITPEQQSLIYFDCGCEIKKRGDKKCPSCEKPKKR